MTSRVIYAHNFAYGLLPDNSAAPGAASILQWSWLAAEISCRLVENQQALRDWGLTASNVS